MSEPLTYESDQLIEEWRERFTGRRTVAHEMLEQAEVLVRHAIAREAQALRRDAATAAREAKTKQEYDLERRERQVEFAERLQKSTEDRLRREVAELEQKLLQLSPRQTLMREERETVDQGTVIRLLAPKVPSYGDKESVRPWMLRIAHLELENPRPLAHPIPARGRLGLWTPDSDLAAQIREQVPA